jgi:hypothetical protein
MTLATASPIAAFVTGIELQGNTPDLPALGADFHRVLLNDLGFFHHLQPCATPAGRFLLLWIQPDTDDNERYWHSLRTLNDRLDELGAERNTVITRLLVHHGIVFTRKNATLDEYVGSAIRTVQMELTRMPVTTGRAATAALAAQMTKQNALGVAVSEPRRGDSVYPLWGLQLKPAITVKRVQPGLPRLTHVDIEYVREQMARQIGPFANTLVHTAVRRARSPRDLVLSLSLEIDDPRARTRFVQTLNAYFDKS